MMNGKLLYTCMRFSSYRKIIGTLNNADKPQAATTRALALHPAIKVEFPVLGRFHVVTEG